MDYYYLLLTTIFGDQWLGSQLFFGWASYFFGGELSILGSNIKKWKKKLYIYIFVDFLKGLVAKAKCPSTLRPFVR